MAMIHKENHGIPRSASSFLLILARTRNTVVGADQWLLYSRYACLLGMAVAYQ
jgi:hypothetical protein